MLKSMRIGRRLWLAFGIVLGLLVLAVGLALIQVRTIGENLGRIVKVYSQEQNLSQEMQFQTQTIQRYLRTILLTDDPAEAEAARRQLDVAREDYRQAASRLEALLISPQAKALFAEVGADRERALALNKQALAKAGQGDRKGAIATLLHEARDANDSWIRKMGDLNRYVGEQLARADATAEEAIRRAVLLLIVFSALAVLAGVGPAFFITRSITGPVQSFQEVLAAVAGGDLRVEASVDSQDEIGQLAASLNAMLRQLRQTIGQMAQAAASVASGATELSASSEQMSAATEQIARGSESVHGTTEQVAAAILQLSASVQQVAGNVKASAEQSAAAVAATMAGQEEGREAAAGMERIRQATASIAKAVGVIQEIARQTNLLSLNAAIEAAKAGASGKGFAVVAEEVRKLAERSRQASAEIEGLLQETHDTVGAGSEAVSATLGRMAAIHEAIGTMEDMIRQIGAATEEQSGTASEVARRVEDTSQAVGQNAAATQQLSATVVEVSRTAADLARVSEGLARDVGQFRF
ncbi:MAG TPA: methyl-accepting chemotaxis protein [Holophagaceae bacterium]